MDYNQCRANGGQWQDNQCINRRASPIQKIKGLSLNTILIIVLVVAVLGIGGLYSINSMSTAEVTTPKWHFKHGCLDNGECYSGVYDGIGELVLTANTPQYLRDNPICRFASKAESYGSTPKECWLTNFTFEDLSFSMTAGQTVQLNDYIEVTWEPDGLILNGDVCHPRWKTNEDGSTERIADECHYVDYNFDWQDPFWTNDFTFNIFNMDFFNVAVKDKHLADTINSEAFITYQIHNDLTNVKGGSVVKEYFSLWHPSNSKKIDFFNILKGDLTYKTGISTETLGDQTISIQGIMIFYAMNMGSKSEVYIYSNLDEKELRILPNISNIPQNDLDFWRSNPIRTIYPETSYSWISWWIIGLIALGGVIYYIKKR